MPASRVRSSRSRRASPAGAGLRPVERADRILVMPPDAVPIWETMPAAMKRGAVVVPATTLLSETGLEDRLERGPARHVVTDAG
ncbi:MAG: hypothetical protein ACOCVZ_04510 [Gemmatimonadota bacterium]